jgi:hypothetical protein
MKLYSIKQLEAMQDKDRLWVFETPLVRMEIWLNMGGIHGYSLRVTKMGGNLIYDYSDTLTPDEVKAAAQAHFERLLTPCLEEFKGEVFAGVKTCNLDGRN